MSQITYEPCPRCVARGNDTRGDNLVCFPTGKHCFACGYHEWPKYPTFTKPVDNGPKSLLPIDFSREVPNIAWKWLLQFELPWKYWQEACGFSAKENRLIFRIGDTEYKNGRLCKTDSPLQFSIGRWISNDQSLRLGGELPVVGTKAPRKWYVWGDPHTHCEVVNSQQGSRIVLVEDIVSAHIVGQVTTAISLFGTQVHGPVLYYLMHDSRPVIFWLDKDQADHVKQKAYNLQVLLNRPVDIIVTDKDPKTHLLSELKTIL